MESVISIELGKRIRLERERLVLNQEAFGVICNVTSRTVIEWEKGKTFPNLLQLFELKEKGVNIGVLFDETFKGKTVEHVAFNDLDFAERLVSLIRGVIVMILGRVVNCSKSAKLVISCRCS